MYPSIRVRTAPPVSVRVRVRVSVSFSFTVLCLQIWRCPNFSIADLKMVSFDSFCVVFRSLDGSVNT